MKPSPPDTTDAIIDCSQDVATRLNAAMPAAVEALLRNLQCGNPEIEVRAAGEVLRHGSPADRAYYIKGYISNQTNYMLTLADDRASTHWVERPPVTIAAFGNGYFEAKYDGFDFEGSVSYVAGEPVGEFKMKWKIPLFGRNKIDAWTSIPETGARTQGGGGWKATVNYFLDSVVNQGK